MSELRERLRSSLPPELDDRVRGELAAWQEQGRMRRLWARDARLWTGTDEADWLGWLAPRPHGEDPAVLRVLPSPLG